MGTISVSLARKERSAKPPAAGARVYCAYACSGGVVDRWRGRLPALRDRTILDFYGPGSGTPHVLETLFDALLPGFHTLRAIQGVDKNPSASEHNIHADALITR